MPVVGSAAEVLPKGVIEHDGKLWKPQRGATASAAEFIAARTLFIELNHDAAWNPWIRDERKADIDEAAEIMGQWQRAEPGHRHLSRKQWEAQQARRDRARESSTRRTTRVVSAPRSVTTSSEPPPGSG